MQKPETKIEIEDGHIYRVTVKVDEAYLEDLLVDNGRRYSMNKGFSFEKEVTDLFAQEYLKRNYDNIAKLVDLETVKLLATRKLANIVSSNAE